MTFRMTGEDVIAAASAQTGLADIGDPAILEGLRRLLDAYASEARFTERGAQMAHGDVMNSLAVRMQVEDWLGKHPELLDRPIEKPLFVFGLPRTGTTLMINLLAADPATRSFLRWEIYEPMPPAKPEELHAGPRYEAQADIPSWRSWFLNEADYMPDSAFTSACSRPCRPMPGGAGR